MGILRELCSKQLNYSNFTRIIRDLEATKVIKSHINRYDKKKYIYLTSFGERLLSKDHNPTTISENTILHDLKVTEICLKMANYPFVNKMELEHEISNKKNFKTSSKVIPDARFSVYVGSDEYKFALELELSQKDTPRIISKANDYIFDSEYRYIIYIFSNEATMKKYKAEVYESLSKEYADRFLFFLDEKLTVNEVKFDQVEGTHQGRKLTLDELFSKLKAYERPVKGV